MLQLLPTDYGSTLVPEALSCLLLLFTLQSGFEISMLKKPRCDMSMFQAAEVSFSFVLYKWTAFLPRKRKWSSGEQTCVAGGEKVFERAKCDEIAEMVEWRWSVTVGSGTIGCRCVSVYEHGPYAADALHPVLMWVCGYL